MCRTDNPSQKTDRSADPATKEGETSASEGHHLVTSDQGSSSYVHTVELPAHENPVVDVTCLEMSEETGQVGASEIGSSSYVHAMEQQPQKLDLTDATW